MNVFQGLRLFHPAAPLKLTSSRALRMRTSNIHYQISRRHFSEQQAGPSPLSNSGEPSANSPPSETKSEQSKTDDAHSDIVVKLQAKEQEVVDLTGRLRYLQADYLNLQRNAAREKEQTRDFAITKFASDLLETVDVLSIALKSVPPSAIYTTSEASSRHTEAHLEGGIAALENQSPESSAKTSQEYLNELYTGVEMTHRLLLQTLFKYGVKPFDPTGDLFDPNRHEALYQAPLPGKASGTIIDCQKVGYTIKDRTLRAAQVGVVSESVS